MGINTLLSTVILVAFIVTLVLAVGSYLAYKMRENRRPITSVDDLSDGPVFFERFYPSPGSKRTTPGSSRAIGRRVTPANTPPIVTKE